MRYRRTSGIGPLKRTRWEDRPFELKMQAGEEANPAPELRLRCFEHHGNIALQGTLRGQECYFADLSPANGKTFSDFVMVSVSNVELRGHVEIVN